MWSSPEVGWLGHLVSRCCCLPTHTGRPRPPCSKHKLTTYPGRLIVAHLYSRLSIECLIGECCLVEMLVDGGPVTIFMQPNLLCNFFVDYVILFCERFVVWACCFYDSCNRTIVLVVFCCLKSVYVLLMMYRSDVQSDVVCCCDTGGTDERMRSSTVM